MSDLNLLTVLADADLNQYAALGVLLLMAIIFGVATLAITTILGPSRKGEQKGMPYESGMNPIGSARRRFNVRFFVVAITFLLFDIEAVYVLAWAVIFWPRAGSPESGTCVWAWRPSPR